MSDMQHAPALSREDPDPTTFPSLLSARDVYLIRSIEWLTMVPDASTQSDALVKANDIGRYFLALGQVSAAKALLDSLPEGITNPYTELQSEEEDEACVLEEHEGLRRLFELFAAHERVQVISTRQLKETWVCISMKPCLQDRQRPADVQSYQTGET